MRFISEIKLPPDKYIKKIDEWTDTVTLNDDHRLLHIWWSNPDQRGEDWTVSLIKKAHDAVIKRLQELFEKKDKKYHHKTPIKLEAQNRDYMPIGPSGEELGDSVSVKEFLKHIGAFQLKHDWIKLVGGAANRGETKNDFDLIIDPINSGDLEHIARFRLARGLPEELSKRLSFLNQKHLRGPFTNFYSLGDLVFIPKNEFSLTRMSFRSAPEEIVSQAEESLDKDSISINRVFYPMKPVRGALEDKPQTISNFVQLVEDFPCFVSKKFDGNTFIFFKNGNKVRAFSDDGLERTDELSQILDHVQELPQKSLIFLAEVELWIDDVHYPRESIRSAFSSHPEWLDSLSVNIFELLYVNGRDIHKLKANQRVSIAQQTFSQLQSIDDKAPEPGLNLVPQYLAEDKEKLEKVTKELSYLPASEGVIVKYGDYALDGKAKVDQEIKFHKAAVVNCVIYERIETKTEGVFVYRYGLPNDLDITPASTVEELVPIGKTFNTAIKADPGDTLSIEFETLNFTKIVTDDTFKISFWIPSVLSKTEQDAASVGTAISKADEKGILRKKWVLAEDTYYDKDKLPPDYDAESSTVATATSDRRELADTPISEQFQAEDPYMEYPPHGEKMDFMRHAHFRRQSVHFDARREIIKDEWAVGWTENVQVEDAISKDIDTLEKAEEICEGYTVKEGNDYLKPLKEAEKIVLEEKAPEPFSWLTVNKVAPPGTPGATSDYPGVLYIIDKGKTEWGTMKTYYHEYFDSEGDIFNGRYICRQLKDRWGITDYETVWFGWYAETALPYVISDRSVEKGWMPPDGQSALPVIIRDVIPEEYHYWKKKGDEAKELRDELVKASLITEDNLSFNDKGEIIASEPVTEQVKSHELDYQIIKQVNGKEKFILLFKKPDFRSFRFLSDAFEEYNRGGPEDEDLFGFSGTIPTQSILNPGDSPIQQEITEQGKAELLLSFSNFFAVRFPDGRLEDTKIFTGGKTLASATSPELFHTKPAVRFVYSGKETEIEKIWNEWGQDNAPLVCEPKIDGKGLILVKKKSSISVYDTHENEISDELPNITKALSKLQATSAVLHAELILDKPYVYTISHLNNIPLQHADELSRKKILSDLQLSLPLRRIPYELINSISELKRATDHFSNYQDSEGILLKTAHSLLLHKETDKWAKVPFVEFFFAKVTDKKQLEDGNFVYSLKSPKFEDLADSQPTSVNAEIGDMVKVSLAVKGSMRHVPNVLSLAMTT